MILKNFAIILIIGEGVIGIVSLLYECDSVCENQYY